MTIKPGIPATPPGLGSMYRYLDSLKQNIEMVTGARGAAAVEPLPATATLADVITAFNALVAQVNFK